MKKKNKSKEGKGVGKESIKFIFLFIAIPLVVYFLWKIPLLKYPERGTFEFHFGGPLTRKIYLRNFQINYTQEEKIGYINFEVYNKSKKFGDVNLIVEIPKGFQFVSMSSKTGVTSMKFLSENKINLSFNPSHGILFDYVVLKFIGDKPINGKLEINAQLYSIHSEDETSFVLELGKSYVCDSVCIVPIYNTNYEKFGNTLFFKYTSQYYKFKENRTKYPLRQEVNINLIKINWVWIEYVLISILAGLILWFLEKLFCISFKN